MAGCEGASGTASVGRQICKPDHSSDELSQQDGRDPLGWVLKYAGSGKLSEEGTLELMRLMVAKGANVTTKAFAENVSWALVPLHPVLKCAA